MNKIFLDTNVLLDALLPDRPSTDASRKILAIGNEETRLCFSSLSVANLVYVLQKNVDKERAVDIVGVLFKKYYVLPVIDMDIYNALRSACPDFEDAMQMSCADFGNCDCIITNNIRHFRGYATLPVYTPEEFLDGICAARSGLSGTE
jgi:predicted nucleic acid-binding protein